MCGQPEGQVTGSPKGSTACIALCLVSECQLSTRHEEALLCCSQGVSPSSIFAGGSPGEVTGFGGRATASSHIAQSTSQFKELSSQVSQMHKWL